VEYIFDNTKLLANNVKMTAPLCDQENRSDAFISETLDEGYAAIVSELMDMS